MRVYKVSYRDQQDGSQGFSYHANRAEAKIAARDWERERAGDENNPVWTEIEDIYFEPTKPDIIDLLNNQAGHADNG